MTLSPRLTVSVLLDRDESSPYADGLSVVSRWRSQPPTADRDSLIRWSVFTGGGAQKNCSQSSQIQYCVPKIQLKPFSKLSSRRERIVTQAHPIKIPAASPEWNYQRAE